MLGGVELELELEDEFGVEDELPGVLLVLPETLPPGAEEAPLLPEELSVELLLPVLELLSWFPGVAELLPGLAEDDPELNVLLPDAAPELVPPGE